jgi:ParB/RepB/Spo0J family partition protein
MRKMAKKKSNGKTLEMLNVVDIIESGCNPRIINESSPKFIELIESIKAVGVKIPIHVRTHPLQKNKYELLAGEKRLRASETAGIKTIPAINYGRLSDRDAFEITFIENFVREDLTPLEEGKAATILLAKYNDDAKAVASKLGKSVRWVLQRREIDRNLCEDGKKLIADPAENFKYWTASHLQLVAALPAETQKGIFGHYTFQEVPTVDELKEEIALNITLLKTAAWKLDDENLVKEAGTCCKCSKRSSVQPELFEDETDANKIKKNNKCLDVSCWNKKLTAYEKLQNPPKEKNKQKPQKQPVPETNVPDGDDIAGSAIEQQFCEKLNQKKYSPIMCKMVVALAVEFGTGYTEIGFDLDEYKKLAVQDVDAIMSVLWGRVQEAINIFVGNNSGLGVDEFFKPLAEIIGIELEIEAV